MLYGSFLQSFLYHIPQPNSTPQQEPNVRKQQQQQRKSTSFGFFFKNVNIILLVNLAWSLVFSFSCGDRWAVLMTQVRPGATTVSSLELFSSQSANLSEFLRPSWVCPFPDCSCSNFPNSSTSWQICCMVFVSCPVCDAPRSEFWGPVMRFDQHSKLFYISFYDIVLYSKMLSQIHKHS